MKIPLGLLGALAVCSPAALGQSIESVLDVGSQLPVIDIVRGVQRRAVNDNGDWVALALNVPEAALVINGTVTYPYIPGVFDSVEGLAINGSGDVAYGTGSLTMGAPPAVRLNAQTVLSSGDPAGVAGVWWSRMIVHGISDGGRIAISGDVFEGAAVEPSNAFGWIDVDLATGAIVGRGLYALEGQPLPAGLGNYAGPLRRAVMSSSGSVMWIGKRAGVPLRQDDFILLDQTVLAIEGSPSPNAGLPWRLGNALLAVSPSANHWAVSGVMSGDLQTANPSAVVVDGALRYGPGMVLPALEPATLEATQEVAVSDAGVVTWLASGDAVDSSFNGYLMRDGQVQWHFGPDEIDGQRYGPSLRSFSPSGEFGAFVLAAQGLETLALYDAFGAPEPCGASLDPFEPNNTCTDATPINLNDFVAGRNLDAAHASTGDDDWYVMVVPPSETLQMNARHTAVSGEVDMQLYRSGCAGSILVGETFQAADDEGLIFENDSQGPVPIFLRIYVPQRSASSCVEYRLALERGTGGACTTGGGPAPDALEPNSGCASPRALAQGDYPGLNVSRIDPDYYVVTVPPGSFATYTATAEDSFGGMTISLQREDCSGFRIATAFGQPATLTLTNDGQVAREAILRITPGQVGAPGCRRYRLNVDYPGDDIGSQICAGVANSTGVGAQLAIAGSTNAADNVLQLRVDALPAGSNGYFLASMTGGFVSNPGGVTQGNLCVVGQVGRLLDSVSTATGAGQAAWVVDLTAVPQPNGAVPALAGQRWYFQYWYRDANPMPTSNFSSAQTVLFL